MRDQRGQSNLGFELCLTPLVMSIVQVHGTGPWGITYLSPADMASKK